MIMIKWYLYQHGVVSLSELVDSLCNKDEVNYPQVNSDFRRHSAWAVRRHARPRGSKVARKIRSSRN